MSEAWSHFVENYAIYGTAISVSIGLITLLYKKGIKPMWNAVAKYSEAIDKIDIIFEELTPNGGKSMKDSLGRIEREVALSRERFRALNADVVEAMFETDLDGNCIWVNRTYCKLVQRTPSELMGHGWINVICQEMREEVVKEWYRSVDQDREFSRNLEFETPDGKCIPVKCNSYKMTSCTGDKLGYLGVVTII
jgi:PAS domain S-box-containing protein